MKIIMVFFQEKRDFFQEKRDFFATSSLWKGKPIIKIPLNIFVDDLSANQSRRWAPLHGIQAQLAGLPLEEKKQEQELDISSSIRTGCNDGAFKASM